MPPCLSYPCWYAYCAVSRQRLQRRCRRAAICRVKRYRPTVSAPVPLRARNLWWSAMRASRPRAIGFSFQYSVMIQQTAALPLDRRWQIDRRHAARKFRNAILDAKMSRCRDVASTSVRTCRVSRPWVGPRFRTGSRPRSLGHCPFRDGVRQITAASTQRQFSTLG